MRTVQVEFHREFEEVKINMDERIETATKDVESRISEQTKYHRTLHGRIKEMKSSIADICILLRIPVFYVLLREKERDLTPSYDKSPYTHS